MDKPKTIREILNVLCYDTMGDPPYRIDYALAQIESIIFERCEAVSQEYQKRIRENYILKTELLEKIGKCNVIYSSVHGNQCFISLVQVKQIVESGGERDISV